MFRLPRSLGPPIAPTAEAHVLRAAGPFTPRNLLVGYLPQAVVSLRIQHEQLMRLDFHQQDCSLVGCSDIRAARQRGEEQGLSHDEIAFYDALAENESAVQVMGDDRLCVIAHELLTSLKSSVSIDWAQREPAHARIRVLVKRILRKYGYPPDLQEAAVRTVLQQAEVLSVRWAA